jgi:soluble lytic murein transglycosylase-like protein
MSHISIGPTARFEASLTQAGGIDNRESVDLTRQERGREDQMRAYFLAGAALISMVPTVAAAGAQPARSVRTVQLISMTGAPSLAPEAAPEEPSGPAPAAALAAVPPEAAALPEAFRVHDLSRQWVAYQMANSLAPRPAVAGAGAGAGAIGNEDPFAPIGVAQPGVPAYASAVSVAPVSAISVPLWMRGGQVFAAAANSYVPGCVPTDYRPSGLLRPDGEFRRRVYFTIMSNVACEYGLPVGLFDAMIIRESRYNASIYSPKNAFGLTQLMPDTAAGLGVNRYDVEQNLRGGARYLRQQLDRFGQYHLALAAYNAGPGRVKNGRVPRITETQDYVSNILLNWSRLS